MYIIAELGINHNGSMETAKQLIDMAAECGADCVKFQKRDIDTVYTQEFLDSPRESPWGNTQRAQKEALEFCIDDHAELKRYTESQELDYLCSAWDLISLGELEAIHVAAHKIASPMLTNTEFVNAVRETGKPVFISTGMTPLIQMSNIVFQFPIDKTTVLHCTSIYPCPDDKAVVSQVRYFKNLFFNCRIGFSSHCVGILAPVLAAAMGAEVIEVHITLDRSMYGSDQSASIERRGLELLVKDCRAVQTVLGNSDKVVYNEEKINAKKLRYWE